MDKTITLPILVDMLCARTDVERTQAENFVRAFTDTVIAAIEGGESVRIKGIGKFYVADGVPCFEPDADLAAGVNAPFAFFEPVELAPEMSVEDISDSPTEEVSTESIAEHADETIDEASVIMDDETTEAESVEETEEVSAVEPDELAESDETEESVAIENSEQPEDIDDNTGDSEEEFLEEIDEEPEGNYEEEPVEKSSSWLLPILMLLIGLIIGFVAGYFLQPTVDKLIAPSSVDEVAEVSEADSVHLESEMIIAEPEPEIEQEPDIIATDTIRRNRFLTTMAREYYNQMEYWVYIYMENRDVLGNPDGASPGTVVRIPSLTRYLPNPTNPSDSVNLAHAKTLATEIYAPYRK